MKTFQPIDPDGAVVIATYIGTHPEATHREVAEAYDISVPTVNKMLFEGSIIILDDCRIQPEDDTMTICQKVHETNKNLLSYQQEYDLDMVMCLFHKLMYSRSAARRNKAKEILRDIKDSYT